MSVDILHRMLQEQKWTMSTVEEDQIQLFQTPLTRNKLTTLYQRTTQHGEEKADEDTVLLQGSNIGRARDTCLTILQRYAYFKIIIHILINYTLPMLMCMFSSM